jgi:hypothetical protein
MRRKLWLAFSAAFLAPLILVVFASPAVAQRNELTGILGRTFVCDQGVTGAVPPDNILGSGKGFTLEANYGRRLIDLGLAGLNLRSTLRYQFQTKR